MKRSNSLDPSRFRFRGLHPHVLLGTASDRYAGWLGKIYSSERYANRISKRTKRLGAKSFIEETLPVESVEEFFDHFRVLEIDFTCYRLLLDRNGKVTPNYHLLKTYKKHLAAEDRILLKAPQTIFSRSIRQQGRMVPNKNYLNADIFVRQFLRPATNILQENLGGIIFEQEYLRKADRPDPRDNALQFHTFFSRIPQNDYYHIELRTEQLLTPDYFNILKTFGIGQVLSHWTWLPSLKKQFQLAGNEFYNTGGHCLLRLITPIGMRYSDTYAAAYPFNRLIDGMLSPKMLDDALDIMITAINAGISAQVIINNRAGGSAPEIARILSEQFLARKQSE